MSDDHDQVRALLHASQATATPGGVLRGAATHSAARLLTELHRAGWRLVRDDEGVGR